MLRSVDWVSFQPRPQIQLCRRVSRQLLVIDITLKESRNNPTTKTTIQALAIATKTTARESDTIVFLCQDALEANLLSMERGKTPLNQNKNTQNN